MKNVLLISNYRASSGGISVQVELLNKNLIKEGIHSEIFSTKRSLLVRLFLLFALIKKAIKFDVLHIHACSYWGFYPVIIGVIAAKTLGKKLIITYHGGDADIFFKRNKSIVGFFLKKSDHNVVLSEYLGKVFKSYDLAYKVIPNIIEFKGNEFVKRESVQPNFISVRSLHELYNVDCIVDAFNIVNLQLPQASLTILGDGPCRVDLEQKVKDLKLGNVTFTGNVNNNEIYNYLSKSDVFISAPKIDNQPVSILEAFNAGVLVISSRVGGIPYMIDEGVNAYMFESGNYNELADKMLLAVKDQAKTKTMIEAAQNSLNLYKWENIKPKLFEIY